jgi:hypothetical protein
LKRWAIVVVSLRDEGPLEFPKGIAARDDEERKAISAFCLHSRLGPCASFLVAWPHRLGQTINGASAREMSK